jgi:subfamily B ATP-binding cassette protein MsbA
MVAFVGSSGVGKSTLLNLLPRFFDPTEGAVLLDDHDLRDLKLVSVRQHVALVAQENPILPTTIAENIAYGRPEATREEIEAAAAMAGADQFIDHLADGYETRITESGQNLSGGQRQRIAIARALLTEAPFIVFDEPTSALDPLRERQFVDALRNLKGERTVILVSHRLSTVVDCDRIYVLDHGKIVECGSHRELLERRGTYWSMACQQFQDNEAPIAA